MRRQDWGEGLAFGLGGTGGRRVHLGVDGSPDGVDAGPEVDDGHDSDKRNKACQEGVLNQVLALGFVTGSGIPPNAETRIKGVWTPSENTMVSSIPQLAPGVCPEDSQSVSGDPPANATFFSMPLALNPTHSPSGDQNTSLASSVPRRAAASIRPRDRTLSGGDPSVVAT